MSTPLHILRTVGDAYNTYQRYAPYARALGMALGKRMRRTWRTGRFRKRGKFSPLARKSSRWRFSRRSGARSFNTEAGRTWSTNFKRRRMGKRRWRRIIFRDTEAKTHWRSNQATVALNDLQNPVTLLTPIDMTLQAVAFVRAIPLIGPDPFWTAPGGLQDKDFGVAAPTFTGGGDLVIRGGIVRLSLSLGDVQNDAVRLKVYAIWAGPNITRDVPVLSALHLDKKKEWDLTAFPDFERLGRILYSKETVIRPGDHNFTIIHRLKPQKIEQSEYILGSSQLWWLITAGFETQSATPVVQQLVRVLRSFNLTFTGDHV